MKFQFNSIQLSHVPENPFKRCFPIQSRRHPQNWHPIPPSLKRPCKTKWDCTKTKIKIHWIHVSTNLSSTIIYSTIFRQPFWQESISESSIFRQRFQKVLTNKSRNLIRINVFYKYSRTITNLSIFRQPFRFEENHRSNKIIENARKWNRDSKSQNVFHKCSS